MRNEAPHHASSASNRPRDTRGALQVPANSIAFVPFSIGAFKMAVEAELVANVGGAEQESLMDTEHLQQFMFVSLAELLMLENLELNEFIVTRGKAGHRDLVFTVAATDRLVYVPLEDICAVPAVAKENLHVPFIWGVARVGDELRLLIDPEKLFDWAIRSSENG